MKSVKPAPDTKRCRKCEVEKPRTDFGEDRRVRDGLQARCRACIANAARDSYVKNRDKILARQAKVYSTEKDKLNSRYRKAKLEAMRHYCNGEPHCVGCGNSTIEVLTIDHIEEDGAEHRKHVRTNRLGEWLKRAGYPEGFQVLCWNCNNAKHRASKIPTYTYIEGFKPSIKYPRSK